MPSIVLGGGCFWCLEASYQLVRGVTAVTNGYAGGNDPHPNYESVANGNSDHAEVVQIEFDESVISLSDLLSIFFVIHDPTTLNRQGADVGPQYRSGIYYPDSTQLKTINSYVDKAAAVWDSPIVTEIAPLIAFYPAEDYHQNYFANHPEQGYCQVVINPKLNKLRAKFADKLIV